MTFLRLTPGHAVAAVAALLLLLVMAMDWYTTAEGEENRRIESIQGEPADGIAGQVSREVTESASITAEGEERNAWDPQGVVEWVALLLLVLAVAAALAAAGLRAAGRRYEPPRAPSVVAGALAAAAAVLVTVHLIVRSADVPGAEIEPGAPLGLLLLGGIAVGAALAARREAGDPAAPAHEGSTRVAT